jgi:hypothetical protein
VSKDHIDMIHRALVVTGRVKMTKLIMDVPHKGVGMLLHINFQGRDVSLNVRYHL